MHQSLRFLLFCPLLFPVRSPAQLNPAITAWLQNTTGTGTYYLQGNPTPIDNGILYNCQAVAYSDDFVYISTNGIPAYPTGPFLDGNPSVAQSQQALFRIPLHPEPQTGPKSPTTGGNIGIFINGVALFDYRDGVAWNPDSQALCGGPGNPPCPGGPMAVQAWNRDAVPAEMDGFDCSKAHPAMGNYHHHQNPSAFKLDLQVLSDICNLYDAEGLYAIDSMQHSPLIGYAYDGYPIYGAYGFANTDGAGGIVRMQSGYRLRDISERTHHADGTDVADGPPVSADFPLGYFREDYAFLPDDNPWVLDEHNGRSCVTPDYPDGTYAYFATVDSLWNSAYPYVVGPTFHGVYQNRKVTSIGEPTTLYPGTATAVAEATAAGFSVQLYPNPTADFLAVQVAGLAEHEIQVEIIDFSGRPAGRKSILPGTTIAWFDTRTLYDGTYVVRLTRAGHTWTGTFLIARD